VEPEQDTDKPDNIEDEDKDDDVGETDAVDSGKCNVKIRKKKLAIGELSCMVSEA